VQLKQEVLEVFRQLQRLHLEVEGRHDEWSPEAVDITDLHAGQLLMALSELRSLVHRRLRTLSNAPSLVSHREFTLYCSLILATTCCTDRVPDLVIFLSVL